MADDKSGRGGDLYDSSMGDDVKGGGVVLDKGGSGLDHHTVYGDDRHFSWNSDSKGDVDRDSVHGTQQGDTNKHDKPW